MKTYKTNIVNYRLVKEPTDIKKIKVTNSRDTAEYIRQLYDKENEDIEVQECFFIVFLNQTSNTIGYKMLAKGGINSTIVDIQLLAKYAINSLSKAVIIAHNHPSGNKQPSGSDKELTKKITEALKLFEIRVLDHIILTDDDYYSFLDNGLITL